MIRAPGDILRRRMLNSVSSQPSGRDDVKVRPTDESKSPA